MPPSHPPPRRPHGSSTYVLPEDGDTPPTKASKPGIDLEARWVQKGGNLSYGYKRHYLADQQTGLVLSVHTTLANVHEGQCIAACLDQVSLPAASRLFADKGYCSTHNREILQKRGLRSGIQRKAYRNRPLSVWEKRYNQLISRSRYKIERVFGSIKRWFGRLEARYVGFSQDAWAACLRGHRLQLIQTSGDYHDQGIAKTEKKCSKGHLTPPTRGQLKKLIDQK